MIEDETFDPIDDALEITDRGAEIMKKEPVSKPVKKVKSGKEDLTKDYEYSRAQLYSLVEKGQLIKHVADTADKLVDLQKKMKDIDEVNTKQNTTNVTNNSLFVGSTADLQKMLKKVSKENQ